MAAKLELDRAKNMDQKHKDLVFGYIRESTKELLQHNTAYYDISPLIIYLCVLYYQTIAGFIRTKLKEIGFTYDWQTVSIESQKKEIIQIKSQSIDLPKHLIINDIQNYMLKRVTKAGIDGLRLSELGKATHTKFRNFNRRNFLPDRKSTFADFVSLCPGLVVVEMDEIEGSNKRMEQHVAVTDSCALKIKLKSKLQLVLSILFDKGKVTNKLEPVTKIKSSRRLCIGERLMTCQDFTDRLKALGFDFNELEEDEIFWSVAGPNSTMIGNTMATKHFTSLVDHLFDPVQTDVAKVLLKLMKLTRLRYRREPLWKRFIVIGTIDRCNNISYLRVTDRRSSSQLYDMISIPRRQSVHGDDIFGVQKSFHVTCKILNKLQYPTICRKINHGSDKFNFVCVTKTPHICSFHEMLNEAITKRSIYYSEYFISQIFGSILETILFCHKHNTVNLNLNINNLGFDVNLRPVLLDFTRSFILSPQDKIDRFLSIISSTPPELISTILILVIFGYIRMSLCSYISIDIIQQILIYYGLNRDNDLLFKGVKLNGNTLRKADSWRCGVLLYTLITGQLPYRNLVRQVLALPPIIPIEEIEWVSDELKDLLSKLLLNEYCDRMNVLNAIKHEWFRKILLFRKFPNNIIDNITNLCKLESAMNWISTITHKEDESSDKQLDRDRKYFGRCDPSGQRKSLKKENLTTFIEDRMGYCKYKAKQIVDTCEYNISGSIEWKTFVSTYVDIQWNESNQSFKAKQFTNAIFKGLDPNGNGSVSSNLLLVLFKDINLKSKRIITKFSMITMVSFEECIEELIYAFRNGFSVKTLLSVDHVIHSSSV